MQEEFMASSEVQAAKNPSFFATVVKNLLLLTACVGMGTGAGWGLAEIQKTQWRSEAQFEQPMSIDLGNYYALASTYALLQGATGEVVDKTIREQSFTEFKHNLASTDAQALFLSQSPIVQKRAELRRLPVPLVVQDFVAQFQFDRNANRISLTLDDPEIARQLLTDFIAFSTLRTRSILNADLVEKWKVLFQQVKSAAENNLGAIQLGSQVAQQDWNGKLNLMKSVQPLDDKLVAYRLVESPSTAQKPHSPDKWFWAAIGAVSGLIIGLFSISLFRVRRNG